jgi:hypothetical protein
MSDETALATTPAQEGIMSTPTKRKPTGKRSSRFGSRFRRQGYRNAGPNGVRTSPPKKGEPPPTTTKDKIYQLGEAVAGAVVTSYLGAYAVKWGLAPELVSTGVGIAGGLVAVQAQTVPVRQAATGAASVAGSQLVLLKFGPTQPAPRLVAVPTPAPAPTAPISRPKNVDLGALPPGMLDAAFERARAELAVTGDGYPLSYEREVMP